MPSLWAAGLLLRRLRAERGIVLLIVLLVATSSFVFAAAPRLFDRAADDALRVKLLAASATQRDVTIRLDAAIAPGPDGGLARVRRFGDDRAARLPPSVAGLISDRALRVTMLRLFVRDPPSYETHLSLRFQDRLEAETRLVAGRWPADVGLPFVPAPFFADEEPVGPEPPQAVVEVAFSVAQAADIGVQLGERLQVISDNSDHLVRGSGFRIAPALVEVVGLFEPIDVNGAYWAGDTDLLVAAQIGSDDVPVADATAYVAEAAYRSLAAPGQPFHYEWRFSVDPERLDAGDVTQLRLDLPRLDSLGGTPPPDSFGDVVVRTGLAGILDRYAAERALAESALSIAALGPFGLASAAMAMVAILLVRRRAAALALARGRGASGSLLLWTQLWEAIIVAGGSALAGLALALVAVPSRPSPASVSLALAVGGAATLLLVGASWRAARRPLGREGRDDAVVIRVPPRRLVVEMTVVGLAVAATFLLQQRGLAATGPDGLSRADPLLASVPLLSGLAAGILALRLYPLPIRLLGWVAARRRDLVPVLGLRTVGRRSGVDNLPLLALLLTAAFGTFQSVIGSSLDRGQVVASYLDVGADYRLERVGSSGMTTIDPATVPGVEAVAGGYVEGNAQFARTERQRASIHVEAIDAPAYATVAAGTPIEPRWPSAFLQAPPEAGVGSEEDPIPAILSVRLPTATTAIRPGDTFRMTVHGSPMTFRLVEQRAAFPGIDDRIPFAIVPYAWARAATANGQLPVLRYWLRGTAEVAAPLASAIDAALGKARTISRHDMLAELRETPLGALVITGYGLAVGVAAIYMALTIIGALIVSAARRTRDHAYLRTLGVSSAQSALLTAMEHVPPVLLAVLPGVALGIGVAVLCLPALGLGTFAGTTTAIPLAIDGASLGLVVGGLIGVVAVAVAAGTWLARRARLVNALRSGDD